MKVTYVVAGVLAIGAVYYVFFRNTPRYMIGGRNLGDVPLDPTTGQDLLFAEILRRANSNRPQT